MGIGLYWKSLSKDETFVLELLDPMNLHRVG